MYFEDFVNDEPVVLEEYYKETVTSFGVHNSSRRCDSLLCDYHHEQAWEMLVKTSKEADQLLAELRACAFASVTKNQYGTVTEILVRGTKIPRKFGPPDYYFRQYWSAYKYFGVRISMTQVCVKVSA